MKNTGWIAVVLGVLALASGGQAQEEVGRPDLMTFAQGVLPITIDTGGADLRTNMEHATAAIDGRGTGLVMTPRPGGADTVLGLVYALPAPTRFDRFAVPGVAETPSPSQTFFKNVRVLGSEVGADGPFEILAQGALATHTTPDEVSELEMVGAAREVSWIRLELSGGISIERDATFLEFSELIGNGTQSGLDLSDRFTGSWRGRGVDLSLAQDGTAVTGCYDGDSPLSGTVDGVVLRALGANPVGIRSQFILIVGEDGAVRGLRSTNGAPFRIYDGAAAAASSCSEPAAPALGCGATIHGIGFGYDSDVIRPQSAPLVAALHESLAGVEASRIEIRGHSSSEGSDSYNLDLSQRRAQSVVNALAALGLDAGKMTALGRGEAEPIASNEDEAGRSLNRRVEVICGG